MNIIWTLAQCSFCPDFPRPSLLCKHCVHLKISLIQPLALNETGDNNSMKRIAAAYLSYGDFASELRRRL